MNKPIIPGSFVQDIKLIIGQARTQAVRSVEFHRVEMYWKLGERIFEEEQQGKERADYGAYLIRKTVLPHVPNCERTAFAIEMDSIPNVDTN